MLIRLQYNISGISKSECCGVWSRIKMFWIQTEHFGIKRFRVYQSPRRTIKTVRLQYVERSVYIPVHPFFTNLQVTNSGLRHLIVLTLRKRDTMLYIRSNIRTSQNVISTQYLFVLGWQ